MSVPVGRCYQSVMRERYSVSDRDGLFGDWWSDLPKNPESASVESARREEIEPLIRRYEWLGNLPDNCSLYAKLTFEGNIAGAVAFSRSGFGGRFSLLHRPAWKLTRGVTLHWAPPWASSFLISRSLRLLFDSPVFVVGFSDWEAGEVGTVYQASGWTYLGASRSREWVSPEGERRDASFHKIRVVSGSQHTKSGRVATAAQYQAERDEMLASGWTLPQRMRGKYATVAGQRGREHRELEEVLAAHAKPYPTRAGSLNGEDASHPSGEGEVRSLVRAPSLSEYVVPDIYDEYEVEFRAVPA